MAWGEIEVEPEVAEWRRALGSRDFQRVRLTVFHKTQQRELAEIDRAERLMQQCIAEGHTADEDSD